MPCSRTNSVSWQQHDRNVLSVSVSGSLTMLCKHCSLCCSHLPQVEVLGRDVGCEHLFTMQLKPTLIKQGCTVLVEGWDVAERRADLGRGNLVMALACNTHLVIEVL
jgi:hypothetical protein